MKRIYFGGTFNPIHIGHTRLALECQQQIGGKCIFVPCGDPSHKRRPTVSAAQRLAMVSLATNELNSCAVGQPFSVEAFEVERTQHSYTLTTLQYLRKSHPQSCLYWLMGMDSLVNLATWHEWQSLTEFANLLVVNRPGWSCPKRGAVARWLNDRLAAPSHEALHGKVVLLETTPLAISSSQLRQQCLQADTGKFLIPEAVRDYIATHGLYRRES